jgi:hypothetical protein
MKRVTQPLVVPLASSSVRSLKDVRVQRQKQEAQRQKLAAMRQARIREQAAHYMAVPLRSIPATAAYLGDVNTKMIRKLIEAGTLEVVRIGGRVMVKTASARRLVESAE